MLYAGFECRDGGLRESNPVGIAVAEGKSIWGDECNPDFILSIGSGQASSPQEQPLTRYLIKDQLTKLVESFFRDLNGRKAWSDFYFGSTEEQKAEAHGEERRARAHRITVSLWGRTGPTEPQWDDVEKMKDLKAEAEKRCAWVNAPRDNSPYALIQGPRRLVELEAQADILRAGLYFFQLNSIDRLTQPGESYYTIRGHIRTRLLPSEKASFDLLMKKTINFQINGKSFNKPDSWSEPEAFMMPVTLGYSPGEELLRIDVRFDMDRRVAIAGFPVTFEVNIDIALSK